jgi:hypothetical protein
MNTSTVLKSLSLFVAAAAIGITGTYARPASASKAVVAAAACDVSPQYGGAFQLNGVGIWNISNAMIDVYCAIPDNAATDKAAITDIWVSFYDGNNNNGASGRILAHTCIWQDAGAGGSCSQDAELTGNTWTGSYSAALDATSRNLVKNAPFWWYPSVVVRVPGASVGGYSYLKGISTN